MSIQVFCPFLIVLLLLLGVDINILNINELSDKWLANIISHSVCCLFILLMISFAVQKLFSLM